MSIEETLDHAEKTIQTHEIGCERVATLQSELYSLNTKVQADGRHLTEWLQSLLQAEVKKATERLFALRGIPQQDDAWCVHAPPFRDHSIKYALYIGMEANLLTYNNGLVGYAARRNAPFAEFQSNEPRVLLAVLRIVVGAGVEAKVPA